MGRVVYLVYPEYTSPAGLGATAKSAHITFTMKPVDTPHHLYPNKNDYVKYCPLNEINKENIFIWNIHLILLKGILFSKL